MKILLLVPCLRRSGPINGVYTLVTQLRRLGVTPDLAALSPLEVDSMEDEFRGLGVEVTILGREVGALSGWRELKGLVATGKYQVIHSTCLRPDIFTALLRGKASGVLSTVRSELYNDLRFSVGTVPAYLITKLHAWALGRMTVVVPHSDAIRTALSGLGVPQSLMQVVNNGVDTDTFHVPDQEERGRARTELGFSKSDVVVGHVGHLSKLKGVSVILEAMARLPRELPVRFLSVGDGDQRELLLQLAAKLGLSDRVHFAGRHENVRAFLRAMDIFVLPSWTEGLPRALIEACATGLPAVVSDIPGCRCVVNHGENGFLVAPGASEAWMDAISSLANSPDARQRMGAASRRKTEENFSARAMATGYLELYLSLV